MCAGPVLAAVWVPAGSRVLGGTLGLTLLVTLVLSWTLGHCWGCGMSELVLVGQLG